MFKQFGLSQSKKQFIRNDSTLFQNSMVLRQFQKNDNINAHLISNCNIVNYLDNQIRQLLKQRKNILRAKQELMIAKNKQKINSINNAREQDIRNQAKLINDRSIVDLIDHADSIARSKGILSHISEIKNVAAYDMSQKAIGKQFWDKHKQFQREKRKKAQFYTSQSKILKELNQKQKTIFYQIQNRQNQIVRFLTKDRNDPDHVNRAQRLNEQVQKFKISLKQIKSEKSRIKSTILKIIEDIVQFNNNYQKMYRSRYDDVNSIFAGIQHTGQYDTIMNSIQKIIVSKYIKNQNANQPIQLQQIFKNYDDIFQDIEQVRQKQDHLFDNMQEQIKQNIKNSILERIFFAGISYKQDQNELLKRLKEYRKLLNDFNQQRPKLQNQINKMSQMSDMLYPIKKAYETQDARRQDLKRQLKRLFILNSDVQFKEKEQRNFNFNMQELHHKRKVIQADINDLAQKVNLVEYKNKMRQLQQINKKISQKNNVVLQQQQHRMKIQLQDSFNKLYDNYEDLISEVHIQQQQLPSLGVFLTKLQKRLSLI